MILHTYSILKFYSKAFITWPNALHRNLHFRHRKIKQQEGILFVPYVCLSKKKIFSKDFSLCHTFPWGRLQLQNLPNKIMPQSKLADPWFINQNMFLVNKFQHLGQDQTTNVKEKTNINSLLWSFCSKYFWSLYLNDAYTWLVCTISVTLGKEH